jgi:hypothetical protein
MKVERSRARISELAKQAGAEPYSAWPRRLARALLRKWMSRTPPSSGLIMFAGEDGPRDLDDPLSDPKVQGRVGEAIAKLIYRPRH